MQSAQYSAVLGFSKVNLSNKVTWPHQITVSTFCENNDDIFLSAVIFYELSLAIEAIALKGPYYVCLQPLAKLALDLKV